MYYEQLSTAKSTSRGSRRSGFALPKREQGESVTKRQDSMQGQNVAPGHLSRIASKKVGRRTTRREAIGSSWRDEELGNEDRIGKGGARREVARRSRRSPTVSRRARGSGSSPSETIHKLRNLRRDSARGSAHRKAEQEDRRPLTRDRKVDIECLSFSGVDRETDVSAAQPKTS